jgi:dipeptidyl aminopeptidase/acylaminoacyl peptidase
LRARLRTAVFAACFAALLVAAPTAHATFPGKNGKIAFARAGDIWTMNPDGTNQVNLTNDPAVEHWPNWSPDGQKIAFDSYESSSQQIWAMNADGTGRTRITSVHPNRGDFEASWSPNGQKLAFASCCPPGGGGDFVLMTINADGTGETFLPVESLRGLDFTDWSPYGTKIAYVDFETCDSDSANVLTVNPDGTGKFSVTDPGGACLAFDDTTPSWSPDAQRIAFSSQPCNTCAPHSIWTVKPDGTDRQQITTAPDSSNEDLRPVWSPDKSKIAFSRGGRIKVMNTDGTGITDITDGTDPSWQPLPVNSYPRPKGATPLSVPLVPANKPCTTPNSTHGAPLSYGSCAPPQLTSDELTTGTPDSNGLPVRMDAFLLLRAIPGNSATTGDEADVKIDAHLNDVFMKDLSDYTGALRASLPLRITDKDNTPSPGGPGAGTTQPFQYGFDLPCTPDPAPNIGSD